jgi:hypothetical protein
MMPMVNARTVVGEAHFQASIIDCVLARSS